MLTFMSRETRQIIQILNYPHLAEWANPGSENTNENYGSSLALMRYLQIGDVQQFCKILALPKLAKHLLNIKPHGAESHCRETTVRKRVHNLYFQLNVSSIKITT